MAAGRAQEYVVERRLRERHLAHRQARFLHQRDEARDGAAAVGDVDDDRIVERAHLFQPGQLLDAQHGAGERCAAVIRVDVHGDHVGANRGLEVRGRALRDDAPGIDDRDLVGEAVGLLQVLRGEEERHAVLAVELLDVAPQRVAADRVEPARRLVEEHDARPVYERRGEVEAALHPAGVRPDAPVRGVLEVDDGEQLGHACLDPGARHAVQAALQRQQLAPGLEVVEARFLQRDADASPHLGRVALHVEAVDVGAAGGGAQQRGEHADRRGLAGAVRPEEAEHLPALDGEVDAVDGAHRGVVPHEALGADRRVLSGRHLLCPPTRTHTARRAPIHRTAACAIA